MRMLMKDMTVPVTRHGRSAPTATAVVAHTGERVHVVHEEGVSPAWLTGLADRLTPARPGQAVVVVGMPLPKEPLEEVCRSLAPMFETNGGAQVRLLVLVMSEGANGSGEHPSVAQVMCERWNIDVLATAGSALVTSDGSFFSPDLPGASGGWWHFSPSAAPRQVSSYLPVPDWRRAVDRVGRQTLAGHVVEPVPAGLVVRPAGPAPLPALTEPHAFAPERGRPHLVLASSGVPAAALAVVMAALPEDVRSALRMVSLDGQPLLRTGRDLADLLGTDVCVAVGAPVPRGGRDAVDALAGDATMEFGMTDAAGRFWRTFARTVVCSPAAAAGAPVRVTEWRLPAGLSGEAEQEVLRLGEHGIAVVTAAGLWVGSGGVEPPYAAVTRPYSRDTLAVDVGVPGGVLEESLLQGLQTLFERLESDVRERVVVHVHGVLGARHQGRLLELCARHGLRSVTARRGAGGRSGGKVVR